MKKTYKKSEDSYFEVEIDREEDGRWIAEISNVPGAMAYGETRSEALRRAYAIALRTLADTVEQGILPLSISHFFNHEMARR
jgi:predicted RNase H-like HicB family nuclease